MIPNSSSGFPFCFISVVPKSALWRTWCVTLGLGLISLPPFEAHKTKWREIGPHDEAEERLKLRHVSQALHFILERKMA